MGGWVNSWHVSANSLGVFRVEFCQCCSCLALPVDLMLLKSWWIVNFRGTDVSTFTLRIFSYCSNRSVILLC